MKLIRYGQPGDEQPGCIDKQGQIRALSAHISDIDKNTLSPESLAKLQQLDIDALPVVAQPVRLGTPWKARGNFICVGLNYRDHAAEIGAEPPTEPVLFTKWCRPTGAHDDIMLPPDSKKADWEVELGIVIGRAGRHIDLQDATSHIAGYCIVNDLTERHYQFDRGGTWDKGKGYEGFGPVGPWLVTRDEIPDTGNLDIWLDINGQRMQTGNTATMIFDVPYLVHYISQFTTLYPGDIISTGTPPGVGIGRKPPVFLRPGDTLQLGITGLGEQNQTIIQPRNSKT